MTQLFDKAVLFGDIHFGLNNDTYDDLCCEFIQYMIDNSKDCDTCIFLGDFFHTRHSLDVKTISKALSSIELLSKSYKKVYMILGNHDMYFRNRRDIHSLSIAKKYPNVIVVEKPMVFEDCYMIPFIVNDENIEYKPAKFVFGHFEESGFMLNKKVRYKDDINLDKYTNYQHVYSGHFHLRQTVKNFTYIGSVFCQNFGDAGDEDKRGFLKLSDDGTEEFFSYANGPKYKFWRISEINKLSVKPNTYLKLINDCPNMSNAELNQIVDTLSKRSEIYNLSVIPYDNDVVTTENENQIVNIENIDETIRTMISNMKYDNIDTKLLVSIYDNLVEEGE